jgi:hypothetical protein
MKKCACFVDTKQALISSLFRTSIRVIVTTPQCFLRRKIKKVLYRPGTLAQAYNPTYLGGGDQKNQDLRPTWIKSS